jgi:uncharacterized membrane protein (DUF2068 family)
MKGIIMNEEKKQELKKQAVEALKYAAVGGVIGLFIGTTWAMRYAKIETSIMLPPKEVYDEIVSRFGEHGATAVSEGRNVVVTIAKEVTEEAAA